MMRFLRYLVVGVVGSVLLIVALAARGALQLHSTPTARINHAIPTHRPVFSQPLFGAVLKNAPYRGVKSVEQLVGKHLAIIEIGQTFDQPIDHKALDLIRTHGSLPMLTWYPWTKAYSRRGGSKAPLERYALRKLYNGTFDAVIRREANAIARYRYPIILRFAPEMNGFWYPWAESPTGNIRGKFRNSNQLGEYVKVWRHVHDLFDQAGASNVIWNWSPNIWYWGQKYSFREYWPGDRYVDLIGIDGYNWGTAADWSKWFTPDRVFDKTLTALRQLSKRPIILSETGSTETGGDKAAWIHQFFQFLRANPDIAAFLWFDYRKETDWRINSSPSAAAAFRSEVSWANGDPSSFLNRIEKGFRRAPTSSTFDPERPRRR